MIGLLLFAATPGLEAYERGDHRAAAIELYAHISKNQDAEDRERAEFLLASSLLELNLRVAAGEYFFNVAKNRTHPELLTDALKAIRELMAGPHDEMLFEKNLLAESELGRFPPQLDSFVSFTKGLEDLRIHQIDWAERHFERIEPSSQHRARALYVTGVQRLRKGDKPEAVGLLRRALAHPSADRELRNQARIALARILFEDGRYEAALDLYQRMELDGLAEPTLHLEKAWSHYHLGRIEAAMGALHALDAPAYRDFHAPEIFLLRALVYQKLCQYIQAKRVIRAFHQRFEETLENIHSRADLRRDPVLSLAAMQRGGLMRVAAFRRAIDEESARLSELDHEPLERHLRELYALKGKQIDQELDNLLGEQTREVAEELIDFEEQMQLMDYELGLAIHQRARAPAERKEQEPEEHDPRAAHFRFDGEFWNEELDDYRFVLEDRCVRRGPGE